MPIDSARPNSLLSSAGSKVAAWNISNWLMASEGMKLAPTSHGCWSYQACALLSLQRPAVSRVFADCAWTKQPNNNGRDRRRTRVRKENPLEWIAIQHGGRRQCNASVCTGISARDDSWRPQWSRGPPGGVRSDTPASCSPLPAPRRRARPCPDTGSETPARKAHCAARPGW